MVSQHQHQQPGSGEGDVVQAGQRCGGFDPPRGEPRQRQGRHCRGEGDKEEDPHARREFLVEQFEQIGGRQVERGGDDGHGPKGCRRRSDDAGSGLCLPERGLSYTIFT